MKEDGIGEARIGDMRNACKISVGQPEDKTSFGRPMCR
jgi:hypothetical protein